MSGGSLRLYEKYSLEELGQMLQDMYNDPANANPEHKRGTSIYLYTKSARKKMDDIAWAITEHLKDGKRDAA